ncbi:MAG TPA: hypothetical protein VFW33_11515 [Gemmataceae bacterium]|nr:hypothetical protein [Gemmataceae bacterium]
MTKINVFATTGQLNVRVKARTSESVSVTVNAYDDERLRFGRGNAKLDDGIWTFSLPAGWFCPHARECLSKADPETGRVKDGKETQFRCFSASTEMRRSVRNARWHNARLLKGKTRDEMAALILDSLSPFVGVVRVHVSGDFYSQEYFDAWLDVARQRERTLIYAYTKALPFWVRRLKEVGTGYVNGSVPNFILTASRGGTHDHLIEEHGLRYATVVYSEAEAEGLGLELDHDDSHAMTAGPAFALLLHGSQPKGSAAAKAVAALRSGGEYGYGARADAIRRERGRMPLKVIR